MVEYPFLYFLFHFYHALELSELALRSMREKTESHVEIGCENFQIGQTILCSLRLLELN